ncbi:MAG: xanthine dehydrogenase family protein molybdopterin-binding subunit [Desulfobacterales bacterium]|nr:xanthine dehydrogenase family protein molybdopterin-binding subunit [Desulfobacterales bacterium]
MSASVSRREFLKKSLAGAGLTIAVSITPFGAHILNASGTDAEALAGFKPGAWFEITPDNRVIVTVSSSEMGQGVHTSLPMILADELEADWETIEVVQAPVGDPYKNPLYHMQLTVGSASIRGYYEPLRKAGAAGRAMLRQAGADALGAPAAECEAVNGVVKHVKSGKSLTYGQLCRKAAKLSVPADPPLKKKEEFRYMGTPMARVDIPDKVSGEAVFGLDVEITGMLYAVLARPPVYGAKILSRDQKAAEAVKGVRKIVLTPRGIAVCAVSLEAAWEGRDALDVKWDKGHYPQMDNAFIEKSLLAALEKPGAVVLDNGDAARALGEAHKKIQATYYAPYIAHAPMEPMNCTAHVQKDRCDVWAPTQGQTVAHMAAAKISGLPPENVHIHTTLMGCGLGRRAAPDFVVEAVFASKASGKPVKVVWSREEDMKYDFFRPATSHKIEAGLDDQGRLTAWSHKVVCPSILKYINPKAIKDGIDFYCLWGLADYPESPHNNSTKYACPNFHVEFLMSDLPAPVAPWRSVQNGPNAFIIESFMDEMALAAGKDPLAFRLSLLKNDKRARRVLELAAEKAGWGAPTPEGRGRGIAQHTCFGTRVAQVAEVSVDRKTGEVKAHRIVAAVDCGPVVNPDTITAQLEGAICMALGVALKEEIMFADGGVASANFDDYDILRMSEVPDIEVHIVKSEESLGGIGEPGIPATAPAVANAVFNAVGARLRRLPLTPGRVLAAM